MSDDPSKVPPAGSEGAHCSSGLTRSARLGLVLFIVYLVLYGGFVLLNAFTPHQMGVPLASLGGLSVAVVYGFGLIAAALILSLVYMILCRNNRGEEADQ